MISAAMLRSSLRPLLVVTLAAAPLMIGCASETDDSASEGAQAVTAECSQQKYDEAFQHYRKAVYGAKARQDGVQVCEGEGQAGNGTEYPLYYSSIADEASAAVMGCGQFRNIIKTSPFAEPLRKELANSLTLKSLTGELLVIRDSQWQNWTGVEGMLPGTSMWTPGNGAVNAHSRIDFKADGKINYYTIGWVGNDVKETDVAGTYRVEKTGAEKDPRRIIIKHGSVTETLDLRVEDTDPGNWSSAPEFKACPAGAQPWDCYRSLGPGECEA